MFASSTEPCFRQHWLNSNLTLASLPMLIGHASWSQNCALRQVREGPVHLVWLPACRKSTQCTRCSERKLWELECKFVLPRWKVKKRASLKECMRKPQSALEACIYTVPLNAVYRVMLVPRANVHAIAWQMNKEGFTSISRDQRPLVELQTFYEQDNMLADSTARPKHLLPSQNMHMHGVQRYALLRTHHVSRRRGVECINIGQRLNIGINIRHLM